MRATFQRMDESSYPTIKPTCGMTVRRTNRTSPSSPLPMKGRLPTCYLPTTEV